ncbi:uncharacterized protein L969DRAFT_88682 [Mixia osmundae IAM 14324]|uniref:Uncharacterized protein n=1 Tax=Mixia osmundae (strain CBS 9802 / IAM 14324 / JCM 22182 / KY 12970) TaxID=764103 RepID=G7DZ28_MIXOS|nr:uncharacterized protein L969DRAFT_88682 [Mixia osmundae IAM 14324]KEI38239.1 hypothetical protein L969DRAFT_88682 [Mixia osmundae IAM 14324]GAA95838.1 hypothetical protein E5Q_02495 [Mixia osmundae IAM 14324]
MLLQKDVEKANLLNPEVYGRGSVDSELYFRRTTKSTSRICAFAAGVIVTSLCSAIVIVSGTRWPAAEQVEPAAPHLQRAFCADPYAEPGVLEFDHSDRLAARWRPYDGQNCPPAPDYTRLLRLACPSNLTATNQSITYAEELRRYTHLGQHRLPKVAFEGMSIEAIEQTYESQQALDELSFLRNKTVLILGDSVDRNSIEQLGEVTDQHVKITRYDSPLNTSLYAGFDPKGCPHSLHFERLNFKVVNGFHYGSDDSDTFAKSQPDWRAPGRFEERVDKLFAPMFGKEDSIADKPDFISFSSGLWDAAMAGRIDRFANRSTERPLSENDLAWYANRLHSMIAHIRATWDAPIWIRGMARPGEQHRYATHDFVGNTPDAEHTTNFFTDARAAQLIYVAKKVAKEANVPYYDFNAVWEGQQIYQAGVHPVTLPAFAAISQPLLHHLKMTFERD